MTVQDLYIWAVQHGCENRPLVMDYDCDDWYYSFNEVEVEDWRLHADNHFTHIHVGG